VSIEERLFYNGKKVIRPFSISAGVKCRDYSLPLQRRIVDFGSDVSFERVVRKMYEHYGVIVPASSVRAIVEGHARMMRQGENLQRNIQQDGAELIVSQIDGTMVPIVQTDTIGNEKQTLDKRKNRAVFWKEARLSLARDSTSVTPVFGAVIGTPEQAGDHLLDCALQVGFGEKSHVHGVGDGALWIADQMERVFGSRASYLIDFYHLCEYLAKAANGCSSAPKVWLEEQKKLLKENDVSLVLDNMRPYLEAPSISKENAPVRNCFNYISNRLRQFDYKDALEKKLPIGSGEIESAHRYVIQQRLKIPGAWWKEENANNMLALRTVRANEDWEDYWKKYTKKAA